MAVQFNVAVLFHRFEFCFNILVVGNTNRVHAAGDAGDGFRNGEYAFFNDLEVADDVHGGIGGDQGDPVDLVVLKKAVADFDDGLAAQGLAVQVHPEGDRVVGLVQTQDVDDPEQLFRGNVVQYGAVVDGADFQYFFFSCFHRSFNYRFPKR